MLDIFCKGSLKSNGVCITDVCESNSVSYSILMKNEGMMKKEERSKDPNTVGCYRAPEMVPLTSITEQFGTSKGSYRSPEMTPPISLPEKLDLFMTTTTVSHGAPGRAPITSVANNLHHHGAGRSRVEDSSESSNAPAASLLKGRKRLCQPCSSDEEDEHVVCVASSPEY